MCNTYKQGKSQLLCRSYRNLIQIQHNSMDCFPRLHLHKISKPSQTELLLPRLKLNMTILILMKDDNIDSINWPSFPCWESTIAFMISLVSLYYRFAWHTLCDTLIWSCRFSSQKKQSVCDAVHKQKELCIYIAMLHKIQNLHIVYFKHH